MPRNGTGTYVPPSSSFNPAVSQTTIDPTDWNALLADFTVTFTGSFSADGQTVATGAFQMGAYRITSLGAGTSPTDAATVAQVLGGTATYAGAAGGTANALTATLSPAITAYSAGQRFTVTAIFGNTGATTINVNALGVKSITDPLGAALVGGEIVDQQLLDLEVVGASIRLLNPANTSTIPPDAEAAAIAIAALGAGIITKDSAGTFFNRALQGTTGEIAIADPGGAANPPTISLPDALTFTSKTVTGGTYVGPLQQTMSYVQLNDATGTGSNTVTLDCSLGNAIKITATGTWTLAASNFPSSSWTEFFIEAVNWGAHHPTFPTGWLFDDGKTNFLAELSSSGTDLLLVTHTNAGTFIMSFYALGCAT